MLAKVRLFAWILPLPLITAGCASAQVADPDLELRRDTEMICRGRDNLDFAKFDRLGNKEKLEQVVFEMMTEYRNPKEQTDAARFLICSVVLSGHLRTRRTIGLLSSIVQDRNLTGNLAALRETAARTLGKIDPVASKDILFSAFERAQPEEWFLRVSIVEALSQANDAQILTKIEQYSRGEVRPYARKKMETAIARMKLRMQKPELR